MNSGIPYSCLTVSLECTFYLQSTMQLFVIDILTYSVIDKSPLDDIIGKLIIKNSIKSTKFLSTIKIESLWP